MSTLVSRAPAKLNLFLHITGKRADGYHLLESLVAFTAFGDDIEVTARPNSLSLSVEGEFAVELGATEHNLVYRAAQLLRERSGTSQGAHIMLRKNLPVGSGFGGGSSDAAAVLKALSTLWGVALDPALAAELGSDVPVCLAAKPAIMRGVGDEITPVSLHHVPLHVVLVHPRTSLMTAEVYKHFFGGFESPVHVPESIATSAQLMELLHESLNALDSAAISVMPIIGTMLATLDATEHCLLARMSGSGAGCFALYETAAYAQAAAQRIRQSHSAWWCVATRLEH